MNALSSIATSVSAAPRPELTLNVPWIRLESADQSASLTDAFCRKLSCLNFCFFGLLRASSSG